MRQFSTVDVWNIVDYIAWIIEKNNPWFIVTEEHWEWITDAVCCMQDDLFTNYLW